MSRNGENIYQRKDGRWEGRYTRGRKKNGAIHFGYLYGKSYKTVYDKLQLLKKQYEEICQVKGTYTGNVSEWLSYWLNNLESEVKPSTYASYHYKIKKYIQPKLGNIPLNELSEVHLNQFRQYCMEELNLAQGTYQVLFTIIRNALENAVKEERLCINVAKEVAMPKTVVKSVKSLTKSQQVKLEIAAKQDMSHGLPTLIALHTGLRIGEIAALKWCNIDLEEQVIHVKLTYQRIACPSSNKTKLILGKVKTQTSERSVPISDKMTQWLKAWQKDTNLASGFVFSRLGRPIEPRLLTYHFKKIAAEAQVKEITFHQLRHTFATRCLEANGDVASISAMLGHASAKTTLDIYIDSLMEQRREVIVSMEKNFKH